MSGVDKLTMREAFDEANGAYNANLAGLPGLSLAGDGVTPKVALDSNLLMEQTQG